MVPSHGGHSMTVTLNYENVTAPGQAVIPGDSVRFFSSGMPNGKNFLTIVGYNYPYWTPPVIADNGEIDQTVVILEGATFNPPLLADGVTRDNKVSVFAYADDDNRLNDGYRAAVSFFVYATR